MQSEKRAQSAMEYLITYSWAIIIIGITIAALYALGLFNPNSFIQSQCIFPADFGCLSSFMYANNGTISLNIQQNTQAPINVTAVGCNSQGNIANMVQFSTANVVYMPIGGNYTFSASCYSNGTIFYSQPGQVFKGYFIINYTNLQTGFQHVFLGKVIEKTT